MNIQLLDVLCCPDCHESLILDAPGRVGSPVDEGRLRCSGCGAAYPIRDGVPRMVSSRRLSGLEQRAVEFFGHEWKVYREWGWNRAGPGGTGLEWTGSLMADAERAFLAKSLLDDADLAGRVVLDAGCGNGRYAYQAARRARLVVAMDISESVDAARENTRHCGNVEVVQGDVLRPPFRAGAFDTVFSIGVLGFTGNAEAACQRLLELVRAEGTIAVQFSHRGNVAFEAVDRAIRTVTSRLSVTRLMGFAAAMAFLGKAAHVSGLARYVNLVVRLQPTRHHMFDWYGARHIDRRRHDDVFRWFARNGVEVVAHDRRDDRSRWLRAVVFPWALAVKGRTRGRAATPQRPPADGHGAAAQGAGRSA